jgi:hypothetical protein
MKLAGLLMLLLNVEWRFSMQLFIKGYHILVWYVDLPYLILLAASLAGAEKRCVMPVDTVYPTAIYIEITTTFCAAIPECGSVPKIVACDSSAADKPYAQQHSNYECDHSVVIPTY